MQPLRTCRDQPAAVSKAGTPNILTTTISPSPPGSAQHRRAPALPLAQNPKLYSSTAGASRRGLPAVHTPGARSTLQFKKHCSGRLLLLVLETVGGKSRQVRKGCMLGNVGYRGAWIMRPCIQRFATCSPCELAEINQLLFLKPAAAAGRGSAF